MHHLGREGGKEGGREGGRGGRGGRKQPPLLVGHKSELEIVFGPTGHVC